MRGIPSGLCKTPRLRVCKILYRFSANSVTNEGPKIHVRIGMYKRMNRVIENKKEDSSRE